MTPLMMAEERRALEQPSKAKPPSLTPFKLTPFIRPLFTMSRAALHA
jgi:hypothetical protein